MDDASQPSSLGKLQEGLVAELSLIRRDLEGRIGPVRAALEAYRRACEDEAAREFASSHNFRRPADCKLSKQRAALNLLTAVKQLPELSESSKKPSERGAGSAREDEPRSEAGWAEPRSRQPGQTARPLSDALPRIAQACAAEKLVVVGVLKGRKRPLPSPLDEATEWVDTSDGGAHAIGNLPQRIRRGRVFGLIVCDQAVSHKHAEPLVTAARKAGVPIGFAAKGGTASVARALEAIEAQLAERK